MTEGVREVSAAEYVALKLKDQKLDIGPYVDVQCPQCKGQGWERDVNIETGIGFKAICETCDGSGVMARRSAVPIKGN